jgi:hypothetical protein
MNPHVVRALTAAAVVTGSALAGCQTAKPALGDRPEAGKAEQDTILIPLSKARADAVENALVDRGLEKGRFTTDGVGASDQLVPDSNLKDRWQNRRVALSLERE